MHKLFTKIIFIFSLFSFCITTYINGNVLNPQSCATLYDHLIEVNIKWQNVDMYSNLDYLELISFENDAQRIQAHFSYIIDYLRINSSKEIESRTKLLHTLEKYGKRGQFPINPYHQIRTPYFIDIEGTHCAVAYLMKTNGDHALVDHIFKNFNNSYIADMPLANWAISNGFTNREIGLIQPGYHPNPRQFFPLGTNGGVNGVINSLAKDENEMLYIGGAFTEVDYQSANGIIAWDGENWHQLADGLNGEVKDLFVFDELVYAAGEFTFSGTNEAINLAEWDGTKWRALQQGDMGGYINAVVRIDNEIYIGGSFSMINGMAADNIARFDIQQQKWLTNAMVDSLMIEEGFGLNKEVKDIKIYSDQKLLVVGAFTETAPAIVGPNPIKQEVNKLTLWNIDSLHWDYSIVYPGEDINTAFVAPNNFDTQIYLGCSLLEEDIYFNNSKYNGWSSIESYYFESLINDFVIHEIIKFGNSILLITGLNMAFVGAGTYGSGIFALEQTQFGYNIRPYASFNNAVRAGISFQGQFYFAGDFDFISGADENGIIGNASLNNLTYSNLSFYVDSKDLTLTENVKVYQQDLELHIEWSDLNKPMHLSLTNIEGKKLEAYYLEGASGYTNIPINEFPPGIYLYHLTDGVLQKTEKIYINRP